MKSIKPNTSLLHLILDQFESSSKWNQDFTGNKSLRIQDDSKRSHYKEIGREELINEAKELERKKLITIKWSQYNFDIELIHYSNQNIPRFYEYAERLPKYVLVNNQKEELLLLAESLKSNSWIHSYLEAKNERISKGIELKEEPKTTTELYRCLKAIDDLIEPMYKRAFSKKALGNSKTFEKSYEKTILTIARKYHPAAEEEMADHEILELLNIDSYASELQLKGNLQLELHGHTIDLGSFLYGTVLNHETLKHATIPDEQHIEKLITIENKANYMAAPYDQNTLYVFTHGYLSPLELIFLRKVKKTLKHAEYYHSGDLDFGGVSIYRYIKQSLFPELQPFHMEAGLLDEYKDLSEELKPLTRKKLIQFYEKEKESLPELKELVEYMIETNRVLEQEAFL